MWVGSRSSEWRASPRRRARSSLSSQISMSCHCWGESVPTRKVRPWMVSSSSGLAVASSVMSPTVNSMGVVPPRDALGTHESGSSSMQLITPDASANLAARHQGEWAMVLGLAARPEDVGLSSAGLDGVDAGLQAEIDKGVLAG